MPVITLPDGSQRAYDKALTVADIAASIGAGLAKAALAGRVNDQLVDTSYVVDKDARVSIITERDKEGLDVIRHSAAHLLAQAVKQLFPSAQVTIGPVIEDGFYYDFAYERSFTPDDLAAIEARMEALANENIPVTRSTMSREEAIAFFKQLGENYKAEIIADIPANEALSLYQQGDFTDLCRGPHVPNTGKLKAFKLTKLAGAYWRGDAKNVMLQRVYGTAWSDKKALQDYLHRLEEAEKRDHRKIGRHLDLFHTEEVAPGMIFWHPKGWTLWQVIEQYMRQFVKQHGYQEVRSPQLLDKSLWERSGHWEKFRADMFVTDSEGREFVVKPMNCPCHVLIFNQGLKSYRDLPIRLSEFGCCHRNEASGTLHGMMRVRSMVQDDAHIFCTEDQLFDETSRFIDNVFNVYADFGFLNIEMKVSTRPEKRVGADEVWDKAEKFLMDALNSKGLSWELNPGEGAFYGPKIEFSLRDCIGRVWQCGTLQVDFSMPLRLDAQYVAADSSRQTPIMLHRAIFGSLERFIGMLIEHYAGNFPVWLAPVQAAIITITDNQHAYAQEVAQTLQDHGFRVTTDLRNEKIGFKIREHTLQRIPYLFVIGDREVQTQTISVRTRESRELGSLPIAAVIAQLQTDLAARGRISSEASLAMEG